MKKMNHQPLIVGRCHWCHMSRSTQVANQERAISLIKTQVLEREQLIQTLPWAQMDYFQKLDGHKLHQKSQKSQVC